MMDVAAVVAAAAGSRGIGYDGKMVSGCFARLLVISRSRHVIELINS
jgi:hypothetical protein